jgi:hypothetical protein
MSNGRNSLIYLRTSKWSTSPTRPPKRCKRTSVTSPVFSPASIKPGGRRINKDVEAIHAAVFDLDDIPEDDLNVLLDDLADRGLAFVFSTTWSHGSKTKPGEVRGRLALPLAEPIPAGEWGKAWGAIRRTVFKYGNGYVDSACKNAGRFYFVPACPKPYADQAWSRHEEGDPVRVEFTASDAPTLDSRITPDIRPRNVAGLSLTKDHVRALASKLKKKNEDALAITLRQIADGKAFATEGNRDNTLWQVATTLADAFRDHSEEDVAGLLKPSLEAMARQGPGAPTFEDALDKVTRAMAHLYETEAEKAAEEDTQLAQDCMDAIGRPEPYGPEETPGRKRWIIQHGASYYFWLDGSYAWPQKKDSA